MNALFRTQVKLSDLSMTRYMNKCFEIKYGTLSDAEFSSMTFPLKVAVPKQLFEKRLVPDMKGRVDVSWP